MKALCASSISQRPSSLQRLSMQRSVTAVAALKPVATQAADVCVALTGAGAAYVALVEDSAPPGLKLAAAAAGRPAEAANGSDDEAEPEDLPVEEEEEAGTGAEAARPPQRMLQVRILPRSLSPSQATL